MDYYAEMGELSIFALRSYGANRDDDDNTKRSMCDLGQK